MRKLLPFLIFAAIVAFSACKKKDNPPSNNANVMFVNGCAGTTAVDVSVGNTKVSGAVNIAFLSNSGYKGITAGNDSMAFILTNLGTPLKSLTSNLTANKSYSVFVGGLITGPVAVLLNDDLTAPPAGYAKVRVVNLSTDAMSVNANLGSTVIATGVGPQGSSAGFVQVAAGSYDIKVGDPTNIGTVVQTSATPLNSGKLYTVMLTGTVSGSSTSALKLTVIGNN
jgi:hypothetical protein